VLRVFLVCYAGLFGKTLEICQKREEDEGLMELYCRKNSAWAALSTIGESIDKFFSLPGFGGSRRRRGLKISSLLFVMGKQGIKEEIYKGCA